MSSFGTSTTAVDLSHADQDLGPLAWILDELRKSLDASAKALRRFVHDSAVAQDSEMTALDAAPLRMARQQLHQACGALEMVGMPQAALFVKAMEAAALRYVQRPELCSEEAVATLERSGFALTDYLESVLAGKAGSAVGLFPQYREVQALCGVDKVHPADLWPVERRLREPADVVAVTPIAYGPQARSRLDQAVLGMVKSGDINCAAALSQVSLGLAAGVGNAEQKTFWKVCGGFFEAFSHGLIASDLYAKRVASRVLMQYASLAKGGEIVRGDRLLHDLLFYCSQAKLPKGSDLPPALRAVYEAFGLGRHLVIDYETPRYGRYDPASLLQARKRITTATEIWSALAGGDRNKLKPAADQFSLVCDSLRKLHKNSGNLADMLSRVTETTALQGEIPSAGLAMEVATAVLYLQAAFEELDTPDSLMTERADRLASRLASTFAGAEPEPLEPWMEELYRRVSDQQTMGSVVAELRATLAEAERAMDQFFRQPDDVSLLSGVPGQLSQMRGVLSVLGLDQASLAVIRMRDMVEHLLIKDIAQESERQVIYEKLGNSLGALGFLIDMLSYQRSLARKLFVFDEELGELRSLMGRGRQTARVREGDAQQSAEHLTQERQDKVASVARAVEIPVPLELKKTSAPAIAAPAVQIKVVDEPTAQQSAPTVSVASLEADVPVAQSVTPLLFSAQDSSSEVQPTQEPQTAQVRQTSKSTDLDTSSFIASSVASDPDESDDELLDIFLEEAREVVENGLSSIQALELDPGELSEQTALRRAFHTLKGSSRMVGLNTFGEAAWSLEQMLNAWLAEQKPVSEPMLGTAKEAMGAFGKWADDIAAKQDQHWSDLPFRNMADAMRLRNERLPLLEGQSSSREEVTSSKPQRDELLEAQVTSIEVGNSIDALASNALSDEFLLRTTDTPATNSESLTVGSLLISEPVSELDESVSLAIAQELHVSESSEEIIGDSGTQAANVDQIDSVTPDFPSLILLPDAATDEFLDTKNASDKSESSGSSDLIVDASVESEEIDFEAFMQAMDAQDKSEDAVQGVEENSAEEGSVSSIHTESADREASIQDLARELSVQEGGAISLVDSTSVAGMSDLEPENAEALNASSISIDAETPSLVIGAGEVSGFDLDFELTSEAIAREADDSAIPEGAEEAPVLLPLEVEAIQSAEIVSVTLEEAVPPEPLATLLNFDLDLPHSSALQQPPIEGRQETSVDSVELFEQALTSFESAIDGQQETDEEVKHIGHLRIGALLYSVYLNEADEWSMRLERELEAWKNDPQPSELADSTAWAHSLAGSSATVGFQELSDLARLLEHTLEHAQLMRSYEWEHVEALVSGAREIRRLLHQFAAGFLKTAQPQVVRALDDVLSTDLVSTGSPAFDEVHMASASPQSARPLAVTEKQVPLSISSLVRINQNEKIDQSVEDAIARVVALESDIDDDLDEIDHIDPDLFPFFEEEGTELFPSLGSVLRQWAAHPQHGHERDAVLRGLHTLKGSARLAGAMRLGEMAHRLESAVEELNPEMGIEPGAVERVIGSFDIVYANFEALKAISHQAPSESHDVLGAGDVLSGASVAGDALPAAVELPISSSEPVDAVPQGVASVFVQAPRTHIGVSARQGAQQSVRVRAQLLDRLVNQAGEVMITRSRLEVRLEQMKSSLGDLTSNLDKLRQQLRDIEVQSESQMQSRLALSKDAEASFDPLEFDRFTRVQELTRMMAESVNDLATVQRNLQRTLDGTEDDLVAQARQARELQKDLLRTRMVEFEAISERLYAVVRKASKEEGKQIKLDISGGSIELDRGVLDRMTPAFEHLLRNCVVHGVESPQRRQEAGKVQVGTIAISLRQEGNDVSVEFSDDGSGLDLDRIRAKAIQQGLIAPDELLDEMQAANLIFMPGFTTASSVTGLAGRGVGMDVVQSEIKALGGRVETHTKKGKGSTFRLVLPLTTAVTQVVMLRAGDRSIGIPANLVEIVRRATPTELETSYEKGDYGFDGENIPFYWSGALLQSSAHSEETTGRTRPVVIVKSASQRVALHVDEVLGSQEVVVKNLGPQLARLPGLAGMSVLPSGAVVLIYNPVALSTVYGRQARETMTQHVKSRALASAQQNPLGQTLLDAQVLVPTTTGKTFPVAPQVPLVLVVDDSITVRRVTQRLLQREGYRVVLAADGLQALERLQEEHPTVVLSDIEMPRMDGFDLARNIRGDAALKHLPIIMITSRIAQKHREHAMELGVNHYLGKPYSDEELLGLIKHYAQEAAHKSLLH